MTDKFTFFRSYWEAIEELNEQETGKLIKAMCQYVFKEEEPNVSGKTKMCFSLMKPYLDANIKKSNEGKKGGRPKKENHS